jgi:hypothetical protein
MHDLLMGRHTMVQIAVASADSPALHMRNEQIAVKLLSD